MNDDLPKPITTTEIGGQFASFDFSNNGVLNIRTFIRRLQENINIFSNQKKKFQIVKELKALKQYAYEVLKRKETDPAAQPVVKPKKKKTYKALLERLSIKTDRIKELTDQARVDGKYKELALNDVKAIVENLIPKSSEDRIASLYLIDSILKNVGNPFIELFQPHVEGILTKTYKYANKNIRIKVRKVFNEWNRQGFFPPQLMNNIQRNLDSYPESPAISSGSAPIIPQPPIANEVSVMLQQMEVKAKTRQDLVPILKTIKKRVALGQDVTRDIMHFNHIADTTPAQIYRQPLDRGSSSSSNKRPNPFDDPRKAKRPRNEPVYTLADGSVTFFACFDREELKKTHKRSLKHLYSERLVRCPTCGLRLKKEDMAKHGDAHYKENEEKKQRGKQSRMRVWYLPFQDWLRDAIAKKPPALFFNETEQQEKKVYKKRVIADENYRECMICGEPFKKVFDQKREDWVYVSTVYEDGKEVSRFPKPIVHQRCYVDSSTPTSTKLFTAQSSLLKPLIKLTKALGTALSSDSDDD